MKPASDCCLLRRRRITALGIQPVKRAEYCFENFYIYGLTEILSGEKFFLELPFVNGECFKLFLREFLQTSNKNTLHLIFLDNASFHSGKCIEAIENVVFINFPAYSPELNPTSAILAGFERLAGRKRD